MAGKKDQLTSELSKFVEQAQWVKAVPALQRLIDLEPNNPQYHLRMGDYSLKAGNKAAAVKAYYQAADLFGKAGFTLKGVAAYKMILKIAPHEMQAATLMKTLVASYGAGFGVAALDDPPPQPVAAEEEADIPIGVTPEPEPAPDPAPTVPDEKSVHLLFASFTSEELGGVVDNLAPMQFVDGERIIGEGEEGDAMYLISRGGGKVVKQIEGQEVVLGELREGEFFGEMSLLVSCPRSASVFAMGDTEVLRLKADDLFDLIKQFPRLGEILDEFYERRSRLMRKKVREIQLGR
jgi:tetratricopeptide (TPR) repeat protein